MPSVSVILVSWNTCELLDQCLGSLRPEAEAVGGVVWVVDNDSSDGSADMVTERHPWVRLIRNGGNVGFARACNLVIAQSAAPFLFFFNPDATLEPGALEALLRVMRERPDIGALMPRLLNADGSPTHFVGRAPRAAALRLRAARTLAWALPASPGLRAFWEREAARYLSHSAGSGGPFERETLEGAALFVRKAALDQVGPFDEGFFCGWEESDLTRRMRKAGWKLALTPAGAARHWDSQSRVQWKWRYWEAPDGFYYARKHGGRPGLLRHFLSERRNLRHFRRTGAPVEEVRAAQARAMRALWKDPGHPGYADFWPDAPAAVLEADRPSPRVSP